MAHTGSTGRSLAYSRTQLCNCLKLLCDSNSHFFGQRTKSSNSSFKFSLVNVSSIVVACNAMQEFKHSIDQVVQFVPSLLKCSSRFDFSPDVPANGFRSIISITDVCLLHSFRIMHDCYKNRSNFTFSLRSFQKELIAYNTVLKQLTRGIKIANYFSQAAVKTNSLFIFDQKIMDIVLNEVESILDHSDPFYGRCSGFQYYASLTKPLQMIGLAMACYSEGFEHQPHSDGLVRGAVSLMSSRKYLTNPEARGRRIVSVTRQANIAFCKAFWSIPETELIQTVASKTLPTLAVNRLIQIDGDNLGVLTLPGFIDGDYVDVPVPSAKGTKVGATVRLLSDIVREGMDAAFCSAKFDTCEGVAGRSDCLVFHCHGGGFVAQSSRAHEPYLRFWAKRLNVPILSVDYSLAPECPYPGGQQEVIYAYAWAVLNASSLGWTGKKVCFVGDSAGANLIATSTLRMIEMGISKLPDGLVYVYGAFLLQYSMSPSRFLSLVDPLVPLGIIVRCIAAYSGNSDAFDAPQWPPKTTKDGSNVAPSTPTDFVVDANVRIEDPVDLVDIKFDYDDDNNNRSDVIPDSVFDTALVPKCIFSKSLADVLESRQGLDGVEIELENASAQIKTTIEHRDHDMRRSKSANEVLPSKSGDNFSNFADVGENEPEPDPVLSRFRRMQIPPDPFMSPCFASQNLLTKMPRSFIVGTHLDPLLDDSITFAKQLKLANVDVEVDVLDALPHGFLNFTMLSPEAKEGSQLCLKRVADVLGIQLVT